MKRIFSIAILAINIFLVVGSSAQSAFLIPNFSGNTSFDGWDQVGLNGTSNPGFPTVMTGANPWPSAIGSHVSGSGDADFIKLSGEGFPSNGFGGGTYVFTAGPGGGTGGTFHITDSTPLNGLGTILFQIDIEGVGTDWTDFLSLVLNYNGGSQALDSDFLTTFSTGPAQSGGIRQIVAFQWDLTSLGPISNFEIAWGAAEHSFFYGFQLHQSDVMTQVVPEPSSWALLFAGVTFCFCLGYQRRKTLL